MLVVLVVVVHVELVFDVDVVLLVVDELVVLVVVVGFELVVLDVLVVFVLVVFVVVVDFVDVVLVVVDVHCHGPYWVQPAFPPPLPRLVPPQTASAPPVPSNRKPVVNTAARPPREPNVLALERLRACA